MRGIIVAESSDATAGTALATSDVYAYFSHLGHEGAVGIATYAFSIREVANLRLWKCSWTEIREITADQALTPLINDPAAAPTYSSRSGIVGRAESAAQGVTKVAGAAMDMKTLGASSTTAAGQGRRTFRGSRWRATNDASVAATAGVLAANVNYVVQLKA